LLDQLSRLKAVIEKLAHRFCVMPLLYAKSPTNIKLLQCTFLIVKTDAKGIFLGLFYINLITLSFLDLPSLHFFFFGLLTTWSIKTTARDSATFRFP